MMSDSERKKELLRLAAKALNDVISPFDNYFLTTNNVTSNECIALGNNIAFCIEWFLMDDLSSLASMMKLKLWALAQMEDDKE